jgi:DNA (cytosine-5)-methyltransferase 1
MDRDPISILFDGISGTPVSESSPTEVGFYWTEGNRGVGWTPNAVPPLKGGSGLSIPSPPAVWQKQSGLFVTPGIEDAERLQGFEPGWTRPASEALGGDRVRWRLIGNAVSVPVAKWLGQQILVSGSRNAEEPSPSVGATSFNAGWGGPSQGSRYLHRAHEGPSIECRRGLAEFGLRDPKALSRRAAVGFLTRYAKSPLAINSEFLGALENYCA